MAGGQELSGPDLSQGIPSSELAEGKMLVGHSGGEGVLLARSNAQVFAVGANCTHYGAPLVDGLLVDGTVRCPWHHACFSLESGEAVRSPARDSLACFDVEERAGKLYVLGKREPKAAPKNPKEPRAIVIVGAGPAGNSAAEKLRRAGYAGKITLVGAEASAPVDRPNLSKDYLAGNAPEEWIALRPAEFYAEQKIELLVSTRVTAIDTKAKTVALENGQSLSYDALLLATGAAVVKPSVPGSDLPHVRTLRTLADSRAIIEQSAHAKHAVVIGAGFIGLEVAASLRARKIDVTVVAPGNLPLAHVLGDELGAALKKLHESRGVTFKLGTRPASINAQTVKLEDGTELPADLVVFGIGVKPSTELAEAAGIKLDRGISVDRYLRTSAPDVYAAGDVARFPDAQTGEHVRVEHWVVATRQGEVAALNLLGHEQPFDSVPFFWSAHYDTTLSYLGHAQKWDRIDVAGSIENLDCALAYRAGDRTLAVVTINRDHVSLEAERALELGDETKLHALIPRG